ncbi:asparagine synthase (glutamine-hydrolyzing) [Lachnoclostridium sp. Marseille-P6806]|uniref:asparagine synthase (glutamine-hydrolyzing) n=1 Tax=Lachnoclostridium sp. Marseille-P6806 TaxID=2364793 RepID=UPI0010318589|nr:asparagine synthase (glutamine-hydrolyzing) [Lachnoclostridium sp. Marseille-P6806]
MCGICGIYDLHGRCPGDRENTVGEMNRAQRHRGPDDEGVFSESISGRGGVSLGHVRLSILDLTARGHQPMQSADGRYILSYNGEVYNYVELREELESEGCRFVTGTDTEVVLAAFSRWGEACQNKFNGFWAFAVYDREERSLFLSRDRYGVKPLYYTELPGAFVFASELKALLRADGIPRKANDAAVLDYLVNGFVDCTEETFLEGVYRLPQGFQMKLSADGSRELRPYYRLEYEEVLTGGAGEEKVSRFRELFRDAVRLRLRSDVPVGSCLSGGLDSSAIVCEIRRQLGDGGVQKTFSTCYPGSPSDESVYIRAVTERTGAESYITEPDGEALFRDLDHLIYMQDEPFVSTSMYASYRVMKLAHEQGARVLMDGQGADELLCGYRKARVYYIRRLLRGGRPLAALREAFLYLPYMRKANSSLRQDLSMLRQFLGAGRKGRGDIKRRYLQLSFAERELRSSYRDSGRFLLNDFERIVLPALLRYVDRNSMAFSIEDRLPFLDWRLVEFSMKLPLDAKIAGGYSKAILRKALDMPELIRRRKDKIGFYTPELGWLRRHEEEYRKLFEEDCRTAKYIDRERLLSDWETLLSGRDDIGIFRYICLEKWMRIFDVTAG